MTLDDIKPYPRNAKEHPKKQVEALANVVREIGWRQPVVVNQQGVIVVGHGRWMVIQEFKDLPPIWVIDDTGKTIHGGPDTRPLSEAQEKMWRLADNQLNALSGFDMDLVVEELKGLSEEMQILTGFDKDLAKFADWKEEQKRDLKDDFIVPPFSILDTRAGYWQDRKRKWKKFIGDSKEGRDDDLLGGLQDLSKRAGASETLNGTSEFDPVLAEICYRWFSPAEGTVLDPFAGGVVRGAVAEILGRKYDGIDLSETQIKTNQEMAKRIDVAPNWIHGTSADIPKLPLKEKYDFILSCPPYYDLEVYSEDPNDLSNKKTYEEFVEEYRAIIKSAVDKLADDRFAVFVVGDIRDKEGYVRGFVQDTIDAFEDAGAKFYNDIILVNAISTAALRARRNFANLKVTRVHQNVLAFYKGDVEKIRKSIENLPKVDRYHENVVVFYKGNIEEIQKNYQPIQDKGLDFIDQNLAQDV